MTTDSQKQERRGAKVYGGTVNAGSGNTSGHKNDVRTDDLSIEFKTTRQKGYYLRLDALRNAEKEALVDGRECIFGLDFVTSKEGTFRYVIMPEDWFLMLLDNQSYEPFIADEGWTPVDGTEA
jgi:hypothetical protein